ncbi:hypothetical protein GF352_05125 [archaeon]|nr:hypothetical protein [archaeon]
MSSTYKSFTHNDAGDSADWSTVEIDLFKDLIDTLVLDCVSAAKDTTNGHRHDKIYASTGGSTAAQTDTLGRLGVGAAPHTGGQLSSITTARKQLHLGYSSSKYVQLEVESDGTLNITGSNIPSITLDPSDGIIINTGDLRHNDYFGVVCNNDGGMDTMIDYTSDYRSIPKQEYHTANSHFSDNTKVSFGSAHDDYDAYLDYCQTGGNSGGGELMIEADSDQESDVHIKVSYGMIVLNAVSGGFGVRLKGEDANNEAFDVCTGSNYRHLFVNENGDICVGDTNVALAHS